MGKTNKKNIRAKAKLSMAIAKNKIQELHAQIKQQEAYGKLLHKTPNKTINKKEKSLQKHKKLLSRFAQMHKERKEDLARQKREKTVITGDMKPLRDALPSLDELYKLANEKKLKTSLDEDQQLEVSPKLSHKQRIKQRKQELLKRFNALDKLIHDKNFKQNPREFIATHVRNKYVLLQEEHE